jgi:soluble lytic murein transglycosylase-like protein
MSTIYDVSFRENIHRITEQTVSRKSRPKGEDNFARVLGELSDESNINSNTNSLSAKVYAAKVGQTSSGLSNSVLTNFNIAERRSLDLPTEKAVHPPSEKEPKQVIESDSGVKSPSKPVKRIALQTYAETQQPRFRLSRSTEPAPVEQIKAASIEPLEVPKVDREGLTKIITAAGKFHGVDPLLSIAVAEAESSLDVRAVSKDGHASKGLFQLLDTTAKDMLGRLEVSDQYDPYDAGMNSHLGVGYLRYLLDSFSTRTDLGSGLRTFEAKTAGDLEKLAVAAFNAGEGNVARAQAQAAKLGTDAGQFRAVEKYLPAITRDYVARVSSLKVGLEGEALAKIRSGS